MTTRFIGGGEPRLLQLALPHAGASSCGRMAGSLVKLSVQWRVCMESVNNTKWSVFSCASTLTLACRAGPGKRILRCSCAPAQERLTT